MTGIFAERNLCVRGGLRAGLYMCIEKQPKAYQTSAAMDWDWNKDNRGWEVNMWVFKLTKIKI